MFDELFCLDELLMFIVLFQRKIDMNIKDFVVVKQFKFMNLYLLSVINDFFYFLWKFMVYLQFYRYIICWICG